MGSGDSSLAGILKVSLQVHFMASDLDKFRISSILNNAPHPIVI